MCLCGALDRMLLTGTCWDVGTRETFDTEMGMLG
jgi:hypothetical protein